MKRKIVLNNRLMLSRRILKRIRSQMRLKRLIGAGKWPYPLWEAKDKKRYSVEDRRFAWQVKTHSWAIQIRKSRMEKEG